MLHNEAIAHDKDDTFI